MSRRPDFPAHQQPSLVVWPERLSTSQLRQSVWVTRTRERHAYIRTSRERARGSSRRRWLLVARRYGVFNDSTPPASSASASMPEKGPSPNDATRNTTSSRSVRVTRYEYATPMLHPGRLEYDMHVQSRATGADAQVQCGTTSTVGARSDGAPPTAGILRYSVRRQSAVSADPSSSTNHSSDSTLASSTAMIDMVTSSPTSGSATASGWNRNTFDTARAVSPWRCQPAG